MNSQFFLSKSKFCSAVQCPKMLWLDINKPELFDESVVRDALLETGQKVGDKARGLFGEYSKVPYGSFSAMIEETRLLIDQKTHVIAEASFSYGSLFCSIDMA